MKWIKVSEPLEPGADFVKLVTAEGKKLALICFNGSFYATQNTCPHAGADLSDGWCEKGKLVCPYHRYEYDLVTGRGNPLQGDYIEVYQVKGQGDGLYAGIPDKRGFWERIFS